MTDDDGRVVELPTELVREVVSWLPASTLLRCSRSLASLNRMILDPHFVNLFQSRNSTLCTTILGFCCDKVGFLLEYHHNDNDKKHSVFAHELDMDPPCFSQDNNTNSTALNVHEAVNSCNGWVLIRSKYSVDEFDVLYTDSLHLVNPVIRRCFTIPCETGLWFDDNHKPEYVLGYGPKTGRYKLVRIVNRVFDVFDVALDGNNSENSWRRINDFDYNQYDLVGDPVMLNGGMHWLLAKVKSILRFDIDKEKFDLLPTPLFTKHMCIDSLYVMGGLLYIGAYNYKFMDFSLGLVIWVMKEDSSTWSCVSVIRDFCHFEHLEIVQVFDGGKKMLMMSHSKKNLQLYDRETGERTTLIMRGINPKMRKRMTFLRFDPSFLSLNNKI
ncbi:hypothetical protein SOVF_123420 [Spinacia oleracea]|uniref:F-box protein At4g09190 n=1 Tax=Spinacia oleracea TaxID=3562 RepID=A0A9R0K413_SPIOL|nr:putative F-box protein At4g09190 [Spinacia oleracea]KNA12713.1 hypothetical protein SOVF_123420 [Spinacia oleracea]